MSETTPSPCPYCGAHQLMDDGIVRWRSGLRPPRSLAGPREGLGVPPRADYDESAYYDWARLRAAQKRHWARSPRKCEK
jgi:hypothetical protein